ncbi:MAG: alpha/beta fold hydrolase [Kiloniellales bacterium]|nr:alpha/beta fold hydrolase [Kiloniellales bacterium]
MPLETVELAYSETGAGPPLVILHGLFGSRRNWAGIARQLGDAYRVFALDLRNHGESPWAESMSYRAMAADVAAFLERQGLEGATVLGHSMGGKAAMLLALERGELVGRLIVVDIAPVAYGHSHLPTIEAMRAIDLSAVSRRGEVDQALQGAVPDPGLRGFLLHNLASEDGRLRWRINLAALGNNMDGLIGYPDDLADLSYDGASLFLAGAVSDYLRAEHHPPIRALFPAAEFDAIAGAGHWVHAEQPEAFLARVQAFLDT